MGSIHITGILQIILTPKRRKSKIQHPSQMEEISEILAFMGCTECGSGCDFAITYFSCWIPHSQSLPWPTHSASSVLSHGDKSWENLAHCWHFCSETAILDLILRNDLCLCIEEGTERWRDSPTQTHIQYSQGSNTREWIYPQHEPQNGCNQDLYNQGSG